MHLKSTCPTVKWRQNFPARGQHNDVTERTAPKGWYSIADFCLLLAHCDKLFIMQQYPDSMEMYMKNAK